MGITYITSRLEPAKHTMPNTQKQAEFDPIEARVLMLRRRLPSSRLAKRFKVSQRAVNAALSGHANMAKLRSRIVDHLKKAK